MMACHYFLNVQKEMFCLSREALCVLSYARPPVELAEPPCPPSVL